MLTLLEIDEMSFTDKMKTMEVIWTSVQNDLENAESPAWHGDILTKRATKIAKGDASFITLDELTNSKP